MAKILALASDATALNLELAGIPVESIADLREAERRCADALEEKPDVLILEEGFKKRFSDRMQDRLARHRGAPLIVYCPAFDGAETDVDAYLSAIIKPAVGFEIRLG